MEKVLINPAFAHILEEIFFNLETEDLSNCMKASPHFKAVLDQPTFWLKKNQIDWSIEKPMVKLWMNLVQLVNGTKLDKNLVRALQILNVLPIKTIKLDEPIGVLVRIGDIELMKYILDNLDKLEYGGLETRLESGLTPWLVAIDQGDEEMLKLLVNTKDKLTHKTALHYAANDGDFGMMQFLLPLVDDLFSQDENRMTPLMYLKRSAFGNGNRNGTKVTSRKHLEILKYFHDYVDEIISAEKMPQYENLPFLIKLHFYESKNCLRSFLEYS